MGSKFTSPQENMALTESTLAVLTLLREKKTIPFRVPSTQPQTRFGDIVHVGHSLVLPSIARPVKSNEDLIHWCQFMTSRSGSFETKPHTQKKAYGPINFLFSSLSTQTTFVEDVATCVCNAATDVTSTSSRTTIVGCMTNNLVTTCPQTTTTTTTAPVKTFSSKLQLWLAWERTKFCLLRRRLQLAFGFA
ncbi:unnamed protein product [Darwinula stevensoni]|uniref:Uncharacterized protein n=1 Tax=Darwinula stevensoni TaxID=69355 RepID=A0A7R8X9X4_9CRUS|nr:unnamed protein product [Darwinula stevensoni]CAG0891020.1 unnamed protein product [Darwinula stevensoni]